jgi:hypothetical protein
MNGYPLFLKARDYTLTNALFLGSCILHAKQTREGRLGLRVVRIIIAALGLIPLIDPIISICKTILTSSVTKQSGKNAVSLPIDFPFGFFVNVNFNKFLSNAFLDKYEIGYRDLQSYYEASASAELRSALNGLDGETKLKNRLIPLLEKYEEISNIEVPYTQRFDIMMDSITHLQVGERILIPIGCKGHATVLLMTKTTDSTFALTHYNTSFGLKHHYTRNEEGILFSKYQTYLTIENVPVESVLYADWKENFLKLKSQENMDFAYDWIRSKVGKEGSLLPAARFLDYYEVPQHSGSCQTQCLMALLRHQIMEMAEGNPPLKKAHYKQIKARMIAGYLRKNKELFSENLKPYVEMLEKKVEAERVLLKIAANKESMEKAIKAFEALFKKMGYTTAQKYNYKCSLIRHYRHLRNLSQNAFRVIFNSNMEYKELNLAEEPAFALLLCKLDQVKHKLPYVTCYHKYGT